MINKDEMKGLVEDYAKWKIDLHEIEIEMHEFKLNGFHIVGFSSLLSV